MTSCIETECLPSSPLLRLPRELRNLIWEYTLVRDTIPIECAVVTGPGYRRHTGFPCPYSPQLHEAYPLNRNVGHRRTWFLPIYDLEVDIQGGTWMEPKRARMTYQLAPAVSKPNSLKSGDDKIAIQLLRVCWMINHEANRLFYEKNVFSFTGQFPISTALAFLQDRSTDALSRLSSIELLLSENNNMRGSAEAHFPPTVRSSDCLVLQHAFHYFNDLCTLLSSPDVHLRRLYLTIESLSSCSDSQPESLAECLAWEVGKSGAVRPWVASWIEPLLLIESLQTISVYWVADRPRVRRMSDTLSMLQRSMLKRADSATSDCVEGHEVDFSILRSTYDSLTTTLIFDPQKEDFESGHCSCDDRVDGLEHIGGSGNIKRAFYKCGVATWKEHQPRFTGFKSTYTAHCHLGSASLRAIRRRSSICAVHRAS